MIKLLIWVFICYGATNIVVYGKIFSGIRLFFADSANYDNIFGRISKFISEMIECAMCFSVWFGFFLSLVLYSPVHQAYNIPIYISFFFDGLLSSGFVWVINTIVEFLEENRIK